MKTVLLISIISLLVLLTLAIIIGKGIKKIQNEPKETDKEEIPWGDVWP